MVTLLVLTCASLCVYRSLEWPGSTAALLWVIRGNVSGVSRHITSNVQGSATTSPHRSSKSPNFRALNKTSVQVVGDEFETSPRKTNAFTRDLQQDDLNTTLYGERKTHLLKLGGTDEWFRIQKEIADLNVRSVQECASRGILVYACENNLCGGWGDRQKGIVSTFLLALLSNRTFVVRIKKPCGLETILAPSVYDWSICRNFSESNNTKNSISVENVSAKTVLDSLKNSTLENELKEEHAIVLHINWYVLPKLQAISKIQKFSWIWDLTHEEIVSIVLNSLFKPNDRLLMELNEFKTKNFQEKHVVCCHIRNGKNPSIPNDSNLPKGRPNVTTVESFLSKYKNSKRYALYLASDSEETKKNFSSLFPNLVVLNRTIVHVDRLGALQNSDTACEGFFTAVFEQYLLSSCDTLVLTRSNFGAVSAYLRGSNKNLYLLEYSTNSVIKGNITDIQRVYRFV